MKKVFKIILIILVVLLVIAISIGAYIYFQYESSINSDSSQLEADYRNYHGLQIYFNEKIPARDCIYSCAQGSYSEYKSCMQKNMCYEIN